MKTRLLPPMKGTRKLTRYGVASGRVMVREASLLDWQTIERLVTSDFSECMSILADTVYGPYLAGAQGSEDIDSRLIEFLKAQYSFVDEASPGSFIGLFFRIKYDFHNLKGAFKEKNFDRPGAQVFLDLGTIDVDDFRRAVEGDDVALPPFWRALIEKVTGALQKEPSDPSIVDMILDRAYPERKLEIAKQEKSYFLIDYCQALIDVFNLKILIRGHELNKKREYFAQAFAEGGKIKKSLLLEVEGGNYERMIGKLLEGGYGILIQQALLNEEGNVRLTSLDSKSEEFLVDKIKRLGRVGIGPEKLLKYILKREKEVACLRILLMGKLHNVSSSLLGDRVAHAFEGGAED